MVILYGKVCKGRQTETRLQGVAYVIPLGNIRGVNRGMNATLWKI